MDRTPDTSNRQWKLLDLLNEASSFFASKEMESARLQAELLLAAALNLNRLELYLQFEKILTPQEVEIFRGFVRERLKGSPVQYVTGKAAFRNLNLSIGSGALIPRPETEVVVEVALDLLAAAGDEMRILDLGCGSGAIGIALCSECPTVRVTASDIDPAALSIAAENVQRHGVTDRIALVCGDLLEPFSDGVPPFDVVVSNPPYIATADIQALQPEVRDHEPHRALDGGADGLKFYRRIADRAADLVVGGGAMVLEVGDGQAPAVTTLLEDGGAYDQIEARCDLAGTERVICCRRR